MPLLSFFGLVTKSGKPLLWCANDKSKDVLDPRKCCLLLLSLWSFLKRPQFFVTELFQFEIAVSSPSGGSILVIAGSVFGSGDASNILVLCDLFGELFVDEHREKALEFASEERAAVEQLLSSYSADSVMKSSATQSARSRRLGSRITLPEFDRFEGLVARRVVNKPFPCEQWLAPLFNTTLFPIGSSCRLCGSVLSVPPTSAGKPLLLFFPPQSDGQRWVEWAGSAPPKDIENAPKHSIWRKLHGKERLFLRGKPLFVLCGAVHGCEKIASPVLLTLLLMGEKNTASVDADGLLHRASQIVGQLMLRTVGGLPPPVGPGPAMQTPAPRFRQPQAPPVKPAAGKQPSSRLTAHRRLRPSNSEISLEKRKPTAIVKESPGRMQSVMTPFMLNMKTPAKEELYSLKKQRRNSDGFALASGGATMLATPLTMRKIK